MKHSFTKHTFFAKVKPYMIHTPQSERFEPAFCRKCEQISIITKMALKFCGLITVEFCTQSTGGMWKTLCLFIRIVKLYTQSAKFSTLKTPKSTV